MNAGLLARVHEASQQHGPVGVHLQHSNRSTARWRLSGDARTFQSEVIAQAVQAGVKQTHELARDRIETRDIRALMAIAMRASQRQIGWIRIAFVLRGDDVVNLKRQRQRKLREQAILASFRRSCPDLPDQFTIHCRRAPGSCGSNTRAFASRTPSKKPTCR